MKWFRNAKFRQACSYAIDREAIIKSIYSGRAIPNYGFVTPGNKKWFNPNIQQYPHDLAKALALLKEIGIEDRNGDGFLEDADGNRIEFVLNTNVGNSAREKAAVLIKSDLEKLGIKVIFQPIEFNTLITKIDDTYDYDCVLMSLGGGGTDPSSSMNVTQVRRLHAPMVSAPENALDRLGSAAGLFDGRADTRHWISPNGKRISTKFRKFSPSR